MTDPYETSDEGKTEDELRAESIKRLTERMAAEIVRSGISLDDESQLTMMLCDRGWQPMWIANLIESAIELARSALRVADAYGLQISDRRVLH